MGIREIRLFPTLARFFGAVGMRASVCHNRAHRIELRGCNLEAALVRTLAGLGGIWVSRLPCTVHDSANAALETGGTCL